jgi:hypothetical protein
MSWLRLHYSSGISIATTALENRRVLEGRIECRKKEEGGWGLNNLEFPSVSITLKPSIRPLSLERR